jgi:hypothetical protein
VIVVQDDSELARAGRELVHHGRDHGFGRRLVRRVEQREDPLLESRMHLLDRGHHVPPQAHRVVVVGVKGDPTHRTGGGPSPLGEQGRLPEPRRGAHQQQLARCRLLDSVQQARPDKDVTAAPRDAELGRQQDVALPNLGARAVGTIARSSLGDPAPAAQLTHPASLAGEVPADRAPPGWR